MRKDSKTIIPYEDIDYELQNLIRLINTVEGIETTSCCCGHGTLPCQILFRADNTAYLTNFWYKYLYCNPNWHIVLAMTDVEIDDKEWNTPTYLLETTFPDFFYTGLAIDNLAYRIEIDKLKENTDDARRNKKI